MSNDSAVSSRSLISELFSGAIYKRSQGRLVRQFTCLAVWVVVALGVWRLNETYLQGNSLIGYLIGTVLLAAGGWFGYRLVNWPRFADFLISVEAEVNKVSWPSWTELVRASVVVIFTIFFLTAVLFGFDALWQAIFTALEIT